MILQKPTDNEVVDALCQVSCNPTKTLVLNLHDKFIGFYNNRLLKKDAYQVKHV